MNLIEKFDAVEIKADNRISEEDKLYCERHQSACEAARSAFQELTFIWSDIENTQVALLSDLKDSPYAYQTYLKFYEGLDINDAALKTHIMALQEHFIENIVYHFTQKYHVSVEIDVIKTHLLPQKPTDRWDENAAKTYEEALQSLQLHYQDILDQIFVHLDGRSFTDQALYEIKKACHTAAWSSYDHKAKYERKKDTIRFSEYGCHYESWFSSEHWELRDGLKNIIRGLAHFETSSLSVIPSELAPLIGYSRLEYNQIDFSLCQKVSQLKMFKNGRVDLKFVSAEHAQEFINIYLGTVY